MPQFILAFPLTKEVYEPLALTETVTLAADAASAIIPGCSVMFKVIRKERVAGLAKKQLTNRPLCDTIFHAHPEASLSKWGRLRALPMAE